MQEIKSWIYVDNFSNLWNFTLKDNKDLQYTIMNKDGKWDEEQNVDKDVNGISVYTFNEQINIIYSNLDAELKYCTIVDDQWMGKVLYKLESNEVQIKDVKTIVIGQDVHIFFVIIDNSSRDHGVILHCLWNGKEATVLNQQDIILFDGLVDYYLVNLDSNNNIDMIFASDEGNEVSLNHCTYMNKKWTAPNRLYGISGEGFEFKILKDHMGIHILNKLKEGTACFLEHVIVKYNGEFANFSIYESDKIIYEPLLVQTKEGLYSCWIEDNKIFCSTFNGSNWSSPNCIRSNDKNNIMKYYFCAAKNKNYNDLDREVYGTDSLSFDLMIPSRLIIGDEVQELSMQQDKKPTQSSEIERKKNKKTKEIVYDEEYEDIDSLINELYKLRADNSALIQTIATLNMQLQNQFENTMHNNYDIEDTNNSNFNLDIQSELDEIYKRLEYDKKFREDIQKRLKRVEEDNKIISDKLDKLIKDNVKLNKALEFEKNFFI